MELIFIFGIFIVLVLVYTGIDALINNPGKHNNNHVYYYTGKPDKKYKTFR